MPLDDVFFQRTGFGESKTFFGGPFYFPYMMGLCQKQQSCSSILDSAKRSFSQFIQAAEPGRFDPRPNNSRSNSFHEDSLF
jgi:hypothetical protein